MCGGLAQAPRRIAPERRPAPALFALLADWSEQFNVRPMKTAGILRAEDGDIIGDRVRWWLTPRWSQSERFPYSTFNARAETVQTARSFRDSFRDRRAIMPANGYFEWVLAAGGTKQPHFIHHADGGMLWLAALWDRWQGDDAAPLDSCAVIVRAAEGPARDVHDRMPLFIPEHSLADWINGTAADAARIMATVQPPPLAHYPVSLRVNSARNEGADLIEPIA